MITNINQLDLDKIYSYADYLTWKFQDRLELIKGKISKMSPAPSTFHQKVASNLHGILWNEFINYPCKFVTACLIYKDVSAPILRQNCRAPAMEPGRWHTRATSSR